MRYLSWKVIGVGVAFAGATTVAATTQAPTLRPLALQAKADASPPSPKPSPLFAANSGIGALLGQTFRTSRPSPAPPPTTAVALYFAGDNPPTTLIPLATGSKAMIPHWFGQGPPMSLATDDPQAPGQVRPLMEMGR